MSADTYTDVTVIEHAYDEYPVYEIQLDTTIEDEHWMRFSDEFNATAHAQKLRVIIDNSDSKIGTLLTGIEYAIDAFVSSNRTSVLWAYITDDPQFETRSRLLEHLSARKGLKLKCWSFPNFDKAMAWVKEMCETQDF